MANDPNTPESHLREEFESLQTLFAAQPGIIQRFLEAQARQVANALTSHIPSARFSLPDRIVAEAPRLGEAAPITIPQNVREQVVGGFKNRILKRDVRDELRQRLTELEQSPDRAVSISTSLIRFAAVSHMVHNMLPAGRTVTYIPLEDEEIPTIPVSQGADPESAITQDSDAIVEDGATDEGRGALQVPFVPAARKFYLPQWVAFDDESKLLVGSLEEAEAHVASMQRFVEILHTAVSTAPYMVADGEYQVKRYGMLGQLINQGRAMTRYKTADIIATIKNRASNNSLNRGLSLDLPFFDDQTLMIDQSHIEVIPAGRIMFVPAFVVRASREEQAKVAQDTRLSPSTRKHLLEELIMLEDAFQSNQSEI